MMRANRPRERVDRARVWRAIAAACVGAGALAGCQSGSASGASADDIPRLLTQIGQSGHAISDSRRVGEHTWTVNGVVEDDYRYRAEVLVDGTLAYEEVDVDDARWVRVANPALVLGPSAAATLATNAATAALLSGRWVTDANGAPSDVISADAVSLPLDPSLVLSALRATEEARTHLDGLREWNPDAIYYIPKDDKFPRHEEDGARFDRVPPKQFDLEHPPGNLVRIQEAFEYDSVWIGSAGITRIERLLAMPGPRDKSVEPIYRLVGIAGGDRLKALFGSGAPVWSETITVHPQRDAVVVAPTGATSVDLTAALRAIKAAVAGVVDPSPAYGPIG